jgi:conjugative relaxase-like TrwC/TraI family protein
MEQQLRQNRVMLTVYTSTSVAEATGYYIEAKTQEAYYSEGQEFTGFWVGQSASRLGLKGRVDKESFVRLCENRDPVTGEPLTAKTFSKRRVGYDFTFGVPKSVSLAYAWTDDDRILRAVRQAGADTIEEIERAVAARVRKGDQDFDRTTGNLVGAEFVHLTARPLDGFPDPHLHLHYFLFNATHDGVEQQWKAVQMGQVMEEADYYSKAFLARLAENLKKIGLEITPTEKAFELAGLPERRTRCPPPARHWPKGPANRPPALRKPAPHSRRLPAPPKTIRRWRKQQKASPLRLARPPKKARRARKK